MLNISLNPFKIFMPQEGNKQTHTKKKNYLLKNYLIKFNFYYITNKSHLNIHMNITYMHQCTKSGVNLKG